MAVRHRTVGLWLHVVVLSVLLGAAMSRALEVSAPIRPAWLLGAALAMLVAQDHPVHLSTSSGRHTVTLTEPLLVLGFFLLSPAELAIGATVGALPGLIGLRPTVVKFAVNVAQTGFWIALPTVAFHHLVANPDPVDPRSAWLAFGIAFLAWAGSALTIRIPIGIVTGRWRLAEGEFAGLLAAGATALAATALALVAAVMASAGPALVPILLLPILQVGWSTAQQRRSVETQRAMQATLAAATALRDQPGAARTLASVLPNLVDAFDADGGLLLCPTTGEVIRLELTEGELTEVRSLRHEATLRAWLEAHGLDGPATESINGGAEIARAYDEEHVLVVPIPTAIGTSGLVLLGRRLGPYLDEHVELAHTLAVAASTALDRERLSLRLDAAGARQAELERRATHDAMTGLHNRAAFEKAVDRVLQAGVPCALMYVDLNGFKQVNDTLGHAAGDRVLVATARRIESTLRSGDLAGRLGGDEFGVLITGASLSLARAIGARLSIALEDPVPDLPFGGGIRAAIGIATAQGGDTTETLIERADLAMYASKRGDGAVVSVVS